MNIDNKNIFQLLSWNSRFQNTEIIQVYLIYINIKVFIENFNTAPTPHRSGFFTGFIEGF
jgi:5-methylcytosine-specific restriction endonuclease McrBC regulatory subunit McrC